MAFSPISGNSRAGQFDAGHVGSVVRQRAQSVAPNVLRDLKPFIDLDDEIDEEELLRLLTLDEVELSEEARDILRKIKKRKKRSRERHHEQTEEEFLGLLARLDAEAAVPVADLPQKDITPSLPPILTLMNYAPALEPPPHRVAPSAPRPSRAPSPTPSSDDDISSLSRAGKLGLAMVAVAPSKSLAMKVARDLEPFGAEILTEVKRFGTRFVIVEPHVAFDQVKIGGLYLFGSGEKTSDGRPWSIVRGMYSSKRRVICVGAELLDQSIQSNRSTVRHEFAHAYEHTWGDKRQRRQPLSVELWYRFAATRQAFISHYASTKPAEYFAESVEALFAPSSSSALRDADPEMYRYLRELFGLTTY